MVWHIWSYTVVILDALMLSVVTTKLFNSAWWFYCTYEIFIILVFFVELPFIYIVDKVITQAMISKKKEELLSQQCEDQSSQADDTESDNSVSEVTKQQYHGMGFGQTPKPE